MYGYIYLGHRLNSIGLEGTYTYGFDRSKASRSFKFFVRTAPMGYGVWQHLERLVYTTAVPVLVQYIPGSIVQAVWTCTCHASNKSSRQHHRSAECTLVRQHPNQMSQQQRITGDISSLPSPSWKFSPTHRKLAHQPMIQDASSAHELTGEAIRRERSASLFSYGK